MRILFCFGAFILCSILVLDLGVDSAPISRSRTRPEVEGFLETFGYVPNGARITESVYKGALERYQKFSGLTVTGEFDEATEAEMAKPRCGLPDNQTSARKKRFTRIGWPFTIKNISYSWAGKTFPSPLNESTVRNETEAAFKLWADVTPLNFYEVTDPSKSHIALFFASGAHGDRYFFDGPLRVLAHAFSPYFNFVGYLNSDAHFDLDETWTSGSNNGIPEIDYFQVATHEFGHTLGLGHSGDRKSVMFPAYTGHNPNFALGTDDIKGIRSIYGTG